MLSEGVAKSGSKYSIGIKTTIMYIHEAKKQ